MTAKEKGYGIKPKVRAVIKVKDEKHLRELLSDGNEHFCGKGKDADIFIRWRQSASNNRFYWFIYFDATDEQQELDDRDLLGNYSWLTPYLKNGHLFCNIHDK